MKKQKIVTFTILASILCCCCCLFGVTLNEEYKIRNEKATNIEVVEENNFIETTSKIIENLQEDFVSEAQVEEEIVEIPIEEETKKDIIEEEIKIEEIIIEDKIIDEPPILIENTSIQANNKYTDILNNMSEEDKDLICRITFREAGNQNIEGQRAVIEVILNRVIDTKWPDSVYGVLSQSGQFSTWGGRNSVAQEDINNIYNLLEIVANEEPILNGNYVYFDGKQHSYGNNYIKIQDHWFATS